MSQQEFADSIEEKRTTIAAWEQGHSYPNALKLITISEFLDISIDDLLKIDLNTNSKENISQEQIKLEKFFGKQSLNLTGINTPILMVPINKIDISLVNEILRSASKKDVE